MATTIPANPSLRNIITAFSNEGFGTGNSLRDYNQGGGIVTSAFSTIPTSKDSLNIRDFSSLSVSGVLDTQSISVVEYYNQSYDPGNQITTYTVEYGYGPNGGSISDGSSNIYGGASISNFYSRFVQRVNQFGIPQITTHVLYLTISGATNSGWSTVEIGSPVGSPFDRSSAGFGNGIWSWSLPNSQYNDNTLSPFYNYIGGTATAEFT